MKILHVASEVAPFAKTGGLADVSAALPKALKRRGHDVRIIMPYYRCVEEGEFAVRKARKSVEVCLAGEQHKGFLRQTSLDEVPIYLVECREFFSRDYLYGTPEGDYPDNPRRFAFFCRSTLQLLKRLDFRPDVIHCHDWQAALIPIILRHELAEDPFFARTALVFTIHNLAYQGVFPPTSLVTMGIDPALLAVDRLEFYSRVNLLKGGILAADTITTVSESYCREIRTPELGCGLDGVLESRRDDLHGIMNGIDTDAWNPATDRGIYRNYSARALAGKSADKRELQRELGLEVSAATPLIGMVSRLAEQKGIELVIGLLPRLAREKVQLVLLGTGEARYLKALAQFRARHSGTISLNLGFHGPLAPKIYAGSDLFLMPSRFEPCGLSQLIAFRYGSVPIVHHTGGLADSVVDATAHPKEGNGFSFVDYSPDGCWDAVQRALVKYADRQEWRRIMRRGMQRDVSWQRAAERYEELYGAELEKKRG